MKVQVLASGQTKDEVLAALKKAIALIETDHVSGFDIPKDQCGAYVFAVDEDLSKKVNGYIGYALEQISDVMVKHGITEAQRFREEVLAIHKLYNE